MKDICIELFDYQMQDPYQGNDFFTEEEKARELTEEQIYNLIPECPLCGCLQGAMNIKLCEKHYNQLLKS